MFPKSVRFRFAVIFVILLTVSVFSMVRFGPPSLAEQAAMLLSGQAEPTSPVAEPPAILRRGNRGFPFVNLPDSDPLKSRSIVFEALKEDGFPEQLLPAAPFASYVVNSNGDTNAVNLTTGTDASGNITLRSAIQAANTQLGAHTITFSGAVVSPINLTLGQITVGNAAAGNSITVAGPGMNLLTVNQTTDNRVFFTGTGAVTFVLQNITLNFTGPGITPYSGGGGAIIAGGAGAATTLTNVAISNFNQQTGNGGAISASSGLNDHDLTITNCIFTNNRAGGAGGAVSFNSQGGTATITGSTFINNRTGPVGANTGGDGGAVSVTGGGDGGTYLIEKNTFLNNQVENVTGHAGAVMNTNGTLTLRYNRFIGNTCANTSFPPLANIVGQAGGATIHTTIANDNWWGVNTGPGPNDATALAPGAVMTLTQWLQLRHSSAPSAVLLGGTSTLTADIFGRNSGGPIAASNLTGWASFPNPAATIFSNAQKGTLSAAGMQFVNGQQTTATFTAGVVSASCGTGGADATADNQTVNAAVIVQCPELTATKTNNVVNAAVVGQTWTWTITVTNGGNAAGTFPTSSTILSDNLPNSANISYGAPTPSIGGVSCTINGSKDLTCTATSPITLAAGGGNFNVQFTAIASPPGTAVGTYANPRGGGTAAVDPNDSVVESNEGNNAFSNTVTVSKANTTTSITNAAALATATVVGQPYAVDASVTVNSPGSGTPTGTITVSDASQTCTITLPATSCNLTSTTAGAKTITATYNNDVNYNGSASTGDPHTVNKADTTTTISNSIVLGTATVVGQSYPVTWSITVNSPGAVGAALTGNVTVSDGSQNCVAAIGTGTCNLTSTTAGAKTITATYAGDSNYNGSTSTGVPHTVNKADTTTIITNAAALATATVVGQPYGVNWSVTVDAPGAVGVPLTGNVTVSDGSQNCVAAVSSGTCSLVSTTTGAKTITAIYAGDTNYNGSTSAGVSHTVNKADTTLTNITDSPDPSATGQAYTVGVTLNVTPPGAGVPGGTIEFSDGTGGTCSALLPATSCGLTTTTAGLHTISATYSGDDFFSASNASAPAWHLVCSDPTVVTSSADSGAGSLRQAVIDACPGSTITFGNGATNFTDATPDTITLTSGQIAIDKDLTIDGPTAAELTVSGNNASRIFYAAPGNAVVLNRLTIANGSDTEGAGILNDQATLTINNSIVRNNTATGGRGAGIANSSGNLTVNFTTIRNNLGPGSLGGGIFSGSTVIGPSVLNVNNSTISDNSASIGGGGIANETLSNANNATATVTNSTISGNTGDNGGGILNYANNFDPEPSVTTLNLNNSTVAKNTGTIGGGGIFNEDFNGLVVANLSSSILADNTSPSGPDIRNLAILGGSYNLVETTTGYTAFGSNNIFGVDPLLVDLADNGGPTQTHALCAAVGVPAGCTAASPAIDQGINAVAPPITTDQRGTGFVRTLDNLSIADAAGGDGTDIGAFEAPVPVPVTINVPATISFTLNSVNYSGPQTVNLMAGNYTLSTTTPQNVGAGVRDVFNNWSDGGAISHTITVASTPLTITGTFTTEYQLTTAANPAVGGTFTPVSGGFYASGSVQNVSATPNPGYVFLNWTGPVADPNLANTTVTMSAPISVTANFCVNDPVVVNNNDAGPGSLRQAVIDACPGNTINFQAGVSPVTLTTAQIVINKDLTIDGGTGATVTRSAAAPNFRIFQVNAGTAVEFRRLTISNGNEANGGGVSNSGSLTLTNSTVSGNTASGFGGGLFSFGPLTITDSTFSGNQAGNAGGFFQGNNLSMSGSTVSGNTTAFQGAGLNIQNANATITNSTISGNVSQNSNGGIAIISSTATVHTLNLINTTITGNTSVGIYGAVWVNEDGGTPSVVTALRNTLVGSNTGRNFSTTTADVNVVALPNSMIVSNGYNLDSDGTSGFVNGVNSDIVGTTGTPINPQLAPLASNGGPTETHALLPTSPAVDMGDDGSTVPTTDQRGSLRPFDIPGVGPAAGGDHSDIGAYELNTIPTTTTLTSSGSPSVFGQTVTFTAAVETDPAGGTVSGNVDFFDGVSPIAGCQDVVLVSNQAQCMISTLSVGPHTIMAEFDENLPFLASSDSIAHQVNKADTTTTVSSSNNPSVFGESVTFTAMVAAVPPGGGVPTGTVTFTVDGNPTCVNVALNGAGQAACTPAGPLSVGNHPVSVTYSGDTNYNASAGSLPTQVVNKADTAIQITGDTPDPTLVGEPYTVTWQVTVVAPGAGTPTGTVTVTDGTGGTCTAPVAAGSCSLTSTTVGVKNLVATYSGDGNFNGSTSAAAQHTVNIKISGNVRHFPGMNGIAGITVTLTGANGGSVFTGVDGYYEFVGVFTGDYTVTPSGPVPGKSYDPISRSFTNVLASISGVDFVAYDTSEDAPRKLRVVSQNVLPGSSVVVPIVIESQGNETSVEFSIEYDPAQFAGPPTVACGSGAGVGCTLVTDYSQPGRVGIRVTPMGGTFAAGEREVVRLTFQTLGSLAADTPVDLIGSPTNLTVTDANGDPLLVELMSGFIIYQTLPAQEGLEGDVAARFTGDGQALSNDVILVRQMAVGLITTNAAFNEFQRADSAPRATLGDGQITTGDVIQTRRYGAGIDPPTPAGGPFGPMMAEPPPAMLSAGETVREVRAMRARGVAGERVTIPVEMKTTGDEMAVSFTLEYDARKLTDPTVTLAGGAPADAVLTVNDKVSGRLTILIDSGTPFSAAGGQLVSVTFDAAQTAPAGETAITITSVSVADANASEMSAAYASGTVTIDNANAPGVRISGRVLTPTRGGLRNAQVTITDAKGARRTVLTSSAGYYHFDSVAPGRGYQITVSSRRYRFTPRAIEASADLTNVDIIAQE